MQFKSSKEANEYLLSLPPIEPEISFSAIIYPWVKIGRTVSVGPYSVIGKDGFGYSKDGRKIPHMAGVILGDNVEIGANCCIDRGKLDDTTIGANTKLDNLVHIAHNCKIGKSNLICAGVIIGGSVTTGDNCFIGLNATIRDHVKIGNNVIIGCGANVVKDVPDGLTVKGNPAK